MKLFNALILKNMNIIKILFIFFHINRSYHQHQLQQSTIPQASDSNTTRNITQGPITPDNTTAFTTTILATKLNPTTVASNANINASPNCCSTATDTISSNSEPNGQPSLSNIIEDMS